MGTVTALKNDTRFDDLVKQVREFGRESALGRDALPKLAISLTQAAADGVTSSQKDKDGNDDVTRLYDEYVAADSKKSIHEHSKDGRKANISKLRQFQKFGEMTTCDPIDVLNRGIIAHGEAAKQAKENSGAQKPRAAYPAYLEVARTQLQQDTPLTDDQIGICVMKPDPKEKTVEKEIERAMNILEKLISGEAGVQDQSDEVVGAFDSLRNRLSTLVSAAEFAKFKEEAERFGYVAAEPEVVAAQ